MKSTLNDKDYVAFARKFVKVSVGTMGINELRDFVINALHEDFQEVYDDLGQRGALDDMLSWDEDVFLDVAEDFDLEFEGIE
tara:strand:+ start:665 stop:910 length:246 start_codon:yes stop_codon:yes gene_type:complete